VKSLIHCNEVGNGKQQNHRKPLIEPPMKKYQHEKKHGKVLIHKFLVDSIFQKRRKV
jgi:hypothetical protein